jgi:hypothetical protein
MMSKVPPTKLEGDNLDELITKAVSEPSFRTTPFRKTEPFMLNWRQSFRTIEAIVDDKLQLYPPVQR